MKVIEGKKKRRKGKIVLYIAIAAFLILRSGFLHCPAGANRSKAAGIGSAERKTVHPNPAK